MHVLLRRLLVEELVRRRPADAQRRYVASQRAGRVDPNPHQIDAVVFALKRIPEGGCILADEVGLGKTIEAGLVIAQLLAEGAQRVLLITPKALLGQWREELFTLFAIGATEAASAEDLAAPGVYLATRDFAGSERGAHRLASVPPFELAVIDEAHEIFAGLHERFDRDGVYDEHSEKALMAGRVFTLLADTPVLLLTATPIQNSLKELWALARYVERTETLLGSLPTFKELFCATDDGRRLQDGAEVELARRLAQICQRTLRRQAQEFLESPFVERRARLVLYPMSAEERALYDDVTTYLLEPGIAAFRGNQRRLLLIGFHRRMASSIPALAASLERVAARLARELSEDAPAVEGSDLDDLEDTLEDLEPDLDEGAPPDRAAVSAERARVLALAARARRLPSDAKAQALVRAVRAVLEAPSAAGGAPKIVIFTESVTTQEYLRTVLVESGLVTVQEVTLFRGQNDGARAKEALARWKREVLPTLPRHAHPSNEIAQRLALCHEFRAAARGVFISTEAGAKGLNLQFASTLVNYDLPWNPQRIEQRIGRVHRYGQTREVVVINFAAEDNEAQQLTLEILAQKLDLFGTVLGASDEVLHEPSSGAPEVIAGALGASFEKGIAALLTSARSQAEVTQGMRDMRDRMAEERARYEETRARMADVIETRFDARVKSSFRKIQDELPQELARFDRDLERVVVGHLEAIGARVERSEAPGQVRLLVEPSDALPEALRAGITLHLGDAREAAGAEPLHLGHPLVRAAVDGARAGSERPLAVRMGIALVARANDEEHAWARLTPGARGRLWLAKVGHAGYVDSEALLPVAVLEGDPGPLPRGVAAALFTAEIEDLPSLDVGVSDEDMEDALDEALFVEGRETSRRVEARFSEVAQQIETSVADRVRLLQRRLAAAQQAVAEAERARDGAVGAEARTRTERALQKVAQQHETLTDEIARLERRDDDAYARVMERAHARAARPPSVARLLDVRFEIAGRVEDRGADA